MAARRRPNSDDRTRLFLPAQTTTISVVSTVAGAIIVATIVGCGLSLTIALLAVRLHEAGYSAQAIGFNTAAGGIATLLAAPVIPWAARILGVARLLMLSLVAGGLSLFAFTLSADYLVWLVLRFVIGFAVTVEFVLSEFWITTWAPDQRRGLAIGVYATSLSVGFAVGPAILTLTGTSGNLPFYCGAVLFLASSMPLALNMRGAPPLDVRSSKTLLTFLREVPAATLAAVVQGAIEVAGLGLLPVYAIRSGLSPAVGALLASAFILGNSALQLPLGFLSDRVDRGRLLLVLGLAGCIGAALLANLGMVPLTLFEGLLLVWGGLVGALYPVGLSQLAALYRDADLASANSAFVMAYAIGMLLGPPVIGTALDIAPQGFFWSIAVLLAAFVVVSGLALTRAGLLTARRSRM